MRVTILGLPLRSARPIVIVRIELGGVKMEVDLWLTIVDRREQTKPKPVDIRRRRFVSKCTLDPNAHRLGTGGVVERGEALPI